jgi:hypothetical protein
MAFPTFTVAQLAQFSGRDLEDYPPYADFALVEATVVFMLLTELMDWPVDPFQQQLAQMGILAFADVLVLQQPYKDAEFSPFQSQNAGSVSWSKPVSYIRGNAQSNALKGESTGIVMFDYAVRFLALRTQMGGVFSSALTMKWDDDSVWIDHDHFTDEHKLTGPAEHNRDGLLGFGTISGDGGDGFTGNFTMGS